MADKTYWKTLEEKAAGGGSGSADEFPEPLEIGSTTSFDRRSFLKAAGFTLGAVTLAGCREGVVEKAIPYLVTPETIVPGRPYWMASTCGGCEAGCGVLVKCRDGRPIKLEGNPDHPVSRGGLCAVGQASLLELYDSKRLRVPLQAGKQSTWNDVDGAILRALDEARGRGGRVRFLTTSDSGPSARGAISRFLAGFADGRVVRYDPLSCSAILDAHAPTHGARVLPRYRFDEADAVVAIDADFLGTWISPVEFTAGYTSRRRLDETKREMSWHAQFEPGMTITGGKADLRVAVRPADVRALLERLAQRVGVSGVVPSRELPAPVAAKVDAAAARLGSAGSRALVVCGAGDVASQRLVNRINQHLGAYGTTLDLSRASLQKQGSDGDLARLVAEIVNGEVDALFVAGVNPVYDLPGSAGLAAAIEKIPLVVSFATIADETSARARFVCPDHHFLEAWRDHEPVTGVVAVGQPAIAPLGATRAMIESLAVWSGTARPAYEILRETWASDVAARAGSTDSADKLWNKTLSTGFLELAPAATTAAWNDAEWSSGMEAAAPATEGLTLVLYPTVGMLDGRHANNPWLHEMPDPVTKVTWDNYASFSPVTAARLGVEEGRVVTIAAGGVSASLPAHVQPGQHDDVVAIAMGYGRTGTERFSLTGPQWIFRRRLQKDSEPVGARVADFATLEGGVLTLSRAGVSVTPTAALHPLAATQQHHSLFVPEHLNPKPGEKRPIVQETTLGAWQHDPHAGEPKEHHFDADLWKPHEYTGHRWGMAIDLSACTGCSGCVISCQAENNVPVVGKDEVLRQREMHWLRIDRYYAETEDGVDMVQQPMMCVHCENASCESVCPVVATVHSEEGLNQQVYNRCVGTRYCANNCAFKVRRFNWFDYPHEDRLQNMVLNPDVTVRSRGVMEKCSMCVQRIEYAKLEAKRRGVPLADGDAKTACEQSCPARAIVFGDINDPESQVSKAQRDPRYYVVLGELNLRPSVGYQRLVRNREEAVARHEEEKHV